MATRSGADTLLTERRELMFPTLTSEQIARIGYHGRRRNVDRGEILIDASAVGEGSICISLVHQVLQA